MRFLHFLILTAFFLCGTTVSANTVLGGNVTWTCLGGNQYQIRLTTYLDCYGLDPVGGVPPVETMFFIPSGCASSTFSADLTHVSHAEISDLCPSEFAFSSCSGGANQGVTQYIYQGTVTLPAGCIWNAVWSSWYWGYFDNSNEFSSPVYINSTINTNFPCYNSPTIGSTPAAPQVAYICATAAENHQLVLNGLPAGYTVTYSTILTNLVVGANLFSPPVGSTGWTNPGISNPVPNAGGAQISWTPGITNLTTNGFRVEIMIYDNLGNHVGTINENMAFYVRNCTATDTQFNTPPVSSVGPETTLTGSNNISVCAGDSLIFTVSAENSNPLRAITITDNLASLGLAGLAATSNGTNPANRTYKLLTTGAHVGTYTLNLTATDDACPNPDTDDETINITVHPNVQLTFTDTTICYGESVTLVAQGLANNAYDWSVQSGDLTPNPTDNVATQIVSPDSTTTYRVAGTGIPAACQSFEDVTVHVVMRDLTHTKTDETCGNNNGTINLTVVGETSPDLTYSWSPNGGATGIVNGIPNQTGVNAGTYIVTVTETVYGCQLTESITIADIPAPTLSFTGTATICEGDCTDLTLDLTSGSAPFDVTGTNLVGTLTDLPDLHTMNVCPTSTTTYTVATVTDDSNCSATINQSVTVTVRPRVTASFAAAGPICLGDNLILNATFSQAGNYTLNYSTTPLLATSPFVNTNGVNLNVSDPTTAITYTYDIDSVEYTNAPTCPSTDANNPSINVVVNPLPTATLTGGGTAVCTGGCRNLTITLTGTGPWTIGYTANGVAQTPFTVPANQSSYTWNVCPTATTTYCITSVQDANCTRPNITGQCATITVTAYPTVNSYTLSDTELCTGESATINVNWGPAGNTGCLHFHSNPTNQGVNTAFCSQSPPNFSLLVTPTTTTAYCLDSVYFTGTAAHCATVLNQCITVNVNGNIAVTATDTICNNISTQYQIQYTVSGGEIGSGYLEAAGGGTGAFNPLGSATYLTSLVNNGPSPSWVFSDVNACNTVTMNTSYTCPVLTNPGTMNLTPINVCGDGQATAMHNGNQVLDGNDELMFVLHNASGTVLGAQLGTNCSAPVFSFVAPMVYGTTYYISAVAGDAGVPAGCVNLGAPAGYVVVSSGTPVTWYEAPTATLSAPGATDACVGSCVTLEIELTGNAPWTINYTIAGVAQTAIPVNVAPPGNIYSMCVTTAGTYTLTGITSGSGPTPCEGTVSGSVAVTINPLPTAVLDADAETCSGIDHCFEIALTGTGPWDVIINDPDDVNDTINGIPTPSPYQYCVGAAGDYNIISITDNNGCTNTTPSDTVNLFVHPLPTVQWTFGDTSFCENSSIELVIAMTGASPFDIDISSPDPQVTTASLQGVLSPDTITVDVEGDYEIVSVTDNNGCLSAAGATIHLDQIDAPIADAGPDLDQCVGLPITIGTPAIGEQTYTWSPLTGIPGTQSDNAEPTVTIHTIPVPNPIEYIVTAHVGVCTTQDTMLLTIHGLPLIQIVADDDSLCANECTNLLVDNLGGGTLTYEWTASASISNPDLTDNPVEVCPSANETFEVTASEVHGAVTCEATETIDIVIGTALTVAEDYTEEVCNGTCEGEILLTASGGFSPYVVSGDLTTTSTTDLCPDEYCYTVTDDIGCVYTNCITIEEREPEVIDDITVTQPTCAYDLGQIQVNNVYTNYTLIPGDLACSDDTVSNSTGTFLGIQPCATAYTIVAEFQVSPGESCTTNTTIVIQPLSPDITFNAVAWPDNLFCYEEQACFDGSPTGGAGPLDITWYSDEQVTIEVSTAEPYCVPMVDDLTLYGVAIDDLGCRSDTVMLEALLYPEITLEVQGGLDTTAICEFDCIDLIAEVSGGNGTVDVNWVQEPTTPIGSGSPLNMCPLFTTTYYAIASDGCSQPVNDTIVVVVHDTPEALIDADIFEGCYPQTINFINLSDEVPDNHTCLWNFGAGTITHCGDTSFTYPNYGTFNPTFTITTEHGCVDIDTLDTPIVIYGKPDMGFTWEPQPVTVIDNQVHFINTTTAGVSYVWTVFGLGSSVLESPTYILPPVDQGSYEVCLEATTIHGCKDTLCQDVFMETVLQVFVPNAFTPDVAGTDEAKVNDVWLPIVTGIDINRYELRVVNHWGEQVFMTTDPYKPWTGNFNDGDIFVPDDTYVWHIKCYEMNSTKLHTFMGHVTIVR